jgi:hypothetical protein
MTQDALRTKNADEVEEQQRKQGKQGSEQAKEEEQQQQQQQYEKEKEVKAQQRKFIEWQERKEAQLFEHFVQRKCDEATARTQEAFAEPKIQTQLWHELDTNSNGHVSLSELQHFIQGKAMLTPRAPGGGKSSGGESSKSLASGNGSGAQGNGSGAQGGFFHGLGHKKATEFACKWSMKDRDMDGDKWLQQHEFMALLVPLLRNVRLLNEIGVVFNAADEPGDSKLNCIEFCEGMQQYGMRMEEAHARRMFARFDKDDSGNIMLSEFCVYLMGIVRR